MEPSQPSIATASATCRTCKGLKPLTQEINFVALRKSAAEGCNSCKLLQDATDFAFDSDGVIEELRLVVDVSLFVHIVGRFNADPTTNDKEDCSQTLKIVELYTLEDGPTIWSTIGPARTVSHRSSDDGCISLAKSWLQSCLSTHSRCKRIDTPPLPTRIIAVGEHEDDVRLHISEPGEQGEYVALSHCWGNGNPKTLTNDGLSSLQNSIVLDESSRTFRDAVNVTRRLGIPYLWIDSLCIIQDDEDERDWKVEYPRMGDIYNNAILTICAAATSGPEIGLFPKSEDRLLVNKMLDFSCPSPNGGTATVHARVRHQSILNKSTIVHSSQETEIPRLDSRGWTFQESNLSPRMLHFRKEELAWTCSTCSACECRLRPTMAIPHPLRAPAGTKHDEAGNEAIHLHWPSAVMDYTRRDLKIDTDRVAALCGIANYIENTTTDTYFCGIWYEDMAFQLTWYINSPAPARFEAPYAPTWSWMSVKSPVNYYHRHPAGIAPMHHSVDNMDAVEAMIHVNFVLRCPADWGNLNGILLAAPLLLVVYMIPVRYDEETQQWYPTAHNIKDFMPSLLRIHIDVEEDLPKNNPDASYVFILAARWKAQGHTIACIEAVCILARKMTGKEEHLIDIAAGLQRHQLEKHPDDVVLKSKPIPALENSYTRIGLARGAGSFAAWEKAEFPMSIIWLF